MEESIQRRERLKLMRLEASQEAATDKADHSTVSLSNPFLESTTNPESQVQSFPQSFNYYTNPMAAYFGNKQNRQVSPQISRDYSSTPQRSQTNETFSSPSLQPQTNHLPNPRRQQPQGQYANSSYTNLSSPSWNNNSPHPGGYPGPGSAGFPSPQNHFIGSPGHGSGQGGYPSPHFANNPGHGPGRGGYPGSGSNQGSGHWLRNNMSVGPSYGRGTGRGSGQGRGRGQGGSHNHVSAEDRPDRFFNKSMMEDPWKFLEPVIWKSQKKQWFPHTDGAKKPRVAESPKQCSSQPSLAEILAASFNEAANDEPNAG